MINLKKIVFSLFIFVIVVASISNKKELLIPSNAIRVRVIANSNDVKDQKTKIDVKNEVVSYLGSLLRNVDNYNEAHSIISENLNNIDDIVKKYNNDYTVSYGNNYFPQKTYRGVIFPEGYYESLVIKLGSGKGNNFWCVMFPPLCLIDEETTSRKEYQFYFLNLLKKIK